MYILRPPTLRRNVGFANPLSRRWLSTARPMLALPRISLRIRQIGFALLAPRYWGSYGAFRPQIEQTAGDCQVVRYRGIRKPPGFVAFSTTSARGFAATEAFARPANQSPCVCAFFRAHYPCQLPTPADRTQGCIRQRFGRDRLSSLCGPYFPRGISGEPSIARQELQLPFVGLSERRIRRINRVLHLGANGAQRIRRPAFAARPLILMAIHSLRQPCPPLLELTPSQSSWLFPFRALFALRFPIIRQIPPQRSPCRF
jgi:hypothetical protein